MPGFMAARRDFRGVAPVLFRILASAAFLAMPPASSSGLEIVTLSSTGGEFMCDVDPGTPPPEHSYWVRDFSFGYFNCDLLIERLSPEGNREGAVGWLRVQNRDAVLISEDEIGFSFDVIGSIPGPDAVVHVDYRGSSWVDVTGGPFSVIDLSGIQDDVSVRINNNNPNDPDFFILGDLSPFVPFFDLGPTTETRVTFSQSFDIRWKLVPIPEPGTASLLLVALVLLSAFNRTGKAN